MIVLFVRLAYLGSNLFGLAGVFIALGFVYALGGIAGHFLLGKILRKTEG
jgi:hypothetical protein